MIHIKRINEYVNNNFEPSDDDTSMNDRVMFRKIVKPSEFSGDVTAVFPDILSDPIGSYKPRNFVMCYDIIGQHGDCDLNNIKTDTVPATEEEYREILDEIQKVGGYIDPIVMTPEEQKAFFRKAPRYINA